MIYVLRALFAAPEAERDPADWATRFAAHVGLACILWLVLVDATDPGWATGILLAGYAAWEAAQWPGGWRMAFDGLLDWVAFALALLGLRAVHHHHEALPFGLAALIVVMAGVWRRR